MLQSLSRSEKTLSAEGRTETKKDSVEDEPVQELSRNNEGKAPMTGSVITIVSSRRDDGLEWEMGPYIPSSSANGYSTVR